MGDTSRKEVAWLRKQHFPTGSSPVVWNPKYAESSDEEYEGFLLPDCLLLSDAGKSTPATIVMSFFKGFECSLVSTTVEKDETKTFELKFPSAQLAREALNTLKDQPLKGRTVCLTRSVDTSYKSFRIRGFKKELSRQIISQQVRSRFGAYGEILHYFFPSEEENDLVYLYMRLKPTCTADQVTKIKNLQIVECKMKRKVTESKLEPKKNNPMESRKRKAPASESESKHRKKRDQSRKEKESASGSGSEPKMEQMNKISDHFKEQLHELNKELLTVADAEISQTDSDTTEVLLSWRKKKPSLISDHATQKKDDCWAHSLARGLSAVMKQHRRTKKLPIPTADLLVEKIEKKYLSKDLSIARASHAAPLLLDEYKHQLTVHHRPELDDEGGNALFERFIERRLAISPVAMCFPCVPGYTRFFPAPNKSKKVFLPEVIDIQALRHEKLGQHCAVITGRGAYLSSDGEWIDFWEIHESRGGEFADEGFTRLERQKCLIAEVFEFTYIRVLLI